MAERLIDSTMDPINIFVAINIAATFGANISGARKGLKSKVTVAREKPNTYLQKIPIILSTLTLIALIFGVFQIGTIEYSNENENLRLAGMIVYITFSWVQIWAFRALGDNYSQEIMIFKEHSLVTKGPFKYIRHPQYMSQILMDIGGGVATLSYVVLILVVIEIPFLIMRAVYEEKILSKYFKEDYLNYKSKSGFMFPFIG
jgi:protein-S-isoprenylcysteine O-methyltransferase Ste14